MKLTLNSDHEMLRAGMAITVELAESEKRAMKSPKEDAGE